jgi:oxygen-independent coproporphyrinogen-3 oxidase
VAPAEDRVDKALASGLVRRVRSGLGGSHTVVTYPPLAALEPVARAQDVERELAPAANLNLYFHLPYCEHVCAFCHYAKTFSAIDAVGDEMHSYLGAMDREIERRRSLIARSTVRSVYVGGGTPTVLSTEALSRLLGTINGLVTGEPPRMCVEVSPQTIMAAGGPEKLALMRGAGVDRISIGVQTFSDRLLKRHRGHDQTAVIGACGRILSAGFKVNIDLIQDLPGQRWVDLELDCHWVEQLRPDQVTWYILRPERGSAWYKPLKDQRLSGMPSDSTSAKWRLRLLDRMERAGYRNESGGRFLAGTFSDHYKQVRSGLDQNLLGIGLSSYSHGWGWFFRNVHLTSTRAGVRAYVGRCDRGESPIEAGLPLAAERGAAERLRALRTHLPHSLIAEAGDEAEGLVRLLEAFAREGLVSWSPAGWSLSRLGLAFEEEILSLFFSPKIRRTLARRRAYWAAETEPLAALLGLSEHQAMEEMVHVAA